MAIREPEMNADAARITPLVKSALRPQGMLNAPIRNEPETVREDVYRVRRPGVKNAAGYPGHIPQRRDRECAWLTPTLDWNRGKTQMKVGAAGFSFFVALDLPYSICRLLISLLFSYAA